MKLRTLSAVALTLTVLMTSSSDAGRRRVRFYQPRCQPVICQPVKTTPAEKVIGPGCRPDGCDELPAESIETSAQMIELPTNASSCHAILITPAGTSGATIRAWFKQHPALQQLAARTKYSELAATEKVKAKWPTISSAPAFMLMNEKGEVLFLAQGAEFPNTAQLLVGLLNDSLEVQAGQWCCPQPVRGRRTTRTQVIYTTPRPTIRKQTQTIIRDPLDALPNALPFVPYNPVPVPDPPLDLLPPLEEELELGWLILIGLGVGLPVAWCVKYARDKKDENEAYLDQIQQA